ncbi:MAG: hypothetical protein JEY96_11090 [Bacteroidales bacterium]|nr:hypothetical protein [Bacteroidales bacterium]
MKVYKLFIFLAIIVTAFSCSEEELSETDPFILLKSGDEFNQSGDYVPIGGQLKFGISAVGDGAAITNLTVQRITDEGIITELDKGIFIEKGGLDTLVTFVKGAANIEKWRFSIMNDHRDTASTSTVIFRGEGSAYGPIDFFPSVTIGYQNSPSLPNYVDLNAGIAYDNTSVSGKEATIDFVSYYYQNSGKSSPTLSCPSYENARFYFPAISDWTTQNSTLYDYYTCDNDVVSETQFDESQNDSLMVNAYTPNSVSGTCKFCYTGKIIPFKTIQGKYGIIKVIRADEFDTGSIEIAIKIQK